MRYPFQDVYLPGTPETARLRAADDAVPPGTGDAVDDPIPALSPERRVPNADTSREDRFRISTKTTTVSPWREYRHARALREIDQLIEEAAQRTRPEGRVRITSGGAVMTPALDPALDTDEEF